MKKTLSEEDVLNEIKTDNAPSFKSVLLKHLYADLDTFGIRAGLYYPLIDELMECSNQTLEKILNIYRMTLSIGMFICFLHTGIPSTYIHN